jgi:hypothetical protein
MAKPAKPKPGADRVKLNLNDASETRVVGAPAEAAAAADPAAAATTEGEAK